MSRSNFLSLPRLLLIAGAFLLAALCAIAPAHADDDFLPPEQAFQLSARMQDAQTIVVNYAIADGYYMYRERFKFTATGARLGEPQIPPGKVKFDETFQKDVETYHKGVEIRIPVEGSGPFTLNVTGQGCADKGLCYPPQDASVQLTAGGGSAPQGGLPIGANAPAPAFSLPGQSQAPAPAGGSRTALRRPAFLGRAFRTVRHRLPAAGRPPARHRPAFILLGLGLAFTPCVLPMVPILSSIIVGEGKVSRARLRAVAGVFARHGDRLHGARRGRRPARRRPGRSAAEPLGAGQLRAADRRLALSMFDVYQLQVPAALQTKLSERFQPPVGGGKLAGVFVMGAMSALIVGPCVAAPLAGALVYISQTRNVLVGGAALFSMAVGMSVPLLLVGLSAGSLLPRAGMWMESVKRFFGVLMLAMALWMAAPVLPAWCRCCCGRRCCWAMAPT
jgi:thiol:disulfide interchange protein DsbD